MPTIEGVDAEIVVILMVLPLSLAIFTYKSVIQVIGYHVRVLNCAHTSDRGEYIGLRKGVDAAWTKEGLEESFALRTKCRKQT